MHPTVNRCCTSELYNNITNSKHSNGSELEASCYYFEILCTWLLRGSDDSSTNPQSQTLPWIQPTGRKEDSSQVITKIPNSQPLSVVTEH